MINGSTKLRRFTSNYTTALPYLSKLQKRADCKYIYLSWYSKNVTLLNSILMTNSLYIFQINNHNPTPTHAYPKSWTHEKDVYKRQVLESVLWYRWSAGIPLLCSRSLRSGFFQAQLSWAIAGNHMIAWKKRGSFTNVCESPAKLRGPRNRRSY